MNGSGSEILPFTPNANPTLVIVLFVIVGFYFLLRMFLIWQESDAKKIHKKHTPNQKPKNTKKEFEQISHLFNFSSEQENVFKELCQENKIQNPIQLAHDYKTLENIINRKLIQLDNLIPPKPNTERIKTSLFMIKDKVEQTIKAGKTWKTTRAIKKNQSLTLILSTGEQYTSILLENTEEGLLLVLPRDISGNELRLPKFTKVEVFLTDQNNQSYRFPSYVIKYVADHNYTRLLLAQSKKIQALPVRKHERMTINVPCTIATVQVANIVNGKKTMHQFFPSKTTSSGSLVEISIGGCSIQTNISNTVQSYIQIQCSLDTKEEDTMIGKILRINKESFDQQVMHVKFVQMPRLTLNKVFSIFYAPKGGHA